jgi:hypothetical protein
LGLLVRDREEIAFHVWASSGVRQRHWLEERIDTEPLVIDIGQPRTEGQHAGGRFEPAALA